MQLARVFDWSTIKGLTNSLGKASQSKSHKIRPCFPSNALVDLDDHTHSEEDAEEDIDTKIRIIAVNGGFHRTLGRDTCAAVVVRHLDLLRCLLKRKRKYFWVVQVKDDVDIDQLGIEKRGVQLLRARQDNEV